MCQKYGIKILFKFGVWRSLVARLLWEQDVVGSNPITPTIKVVRTMRLITNLYKNTYLLGSLVGLSVFLIWLQLFNPDSVIESQIFKLAEQSSEMLSKVPSATSSVLGKVPQNFVVSIEPGDTLDHILQEKGISRQQSHLAIKAISKYVNPRKIRVNEKVSLLIRQVDEDKAELLRLSFAKSTKERIEIIYHRDGYFNAKILTKELQKTTQNTHVTISSSLYADAQRQQVPYTILRQLIAAYSYDVDFQRDIKSGDSFKAFYETLLDPDSGETDSATLVYADLILSGKGKPVYYFETSSGSGYYYGDGQSVKAQFLATPINGARISGTFGRRMHPIYGYSLMHKGVDFAAPSGTPVMAAADGTIVRAEWYSTYGKFIEVRHSNGYSTAYAHLKGYAKNLRVGKKVEQGDIIGYVGSTGNSTGPHLHYEVRHKGVQINPQSKDLHRHGSSRLAGADLKRFLEHKKQVDAQVAAEKYNNNRKKFAFLF